ncbi:MAG TPA: phytanoyl-CoA dioxygenase family protein [Chthonomonadaceae bacterium]|nr:phytanoyl-CoA dioxygenase family protein [Chthonomonadaceae bacterium]
MDYTLTDEERAQYRRDGYLIKRGIVPQADLDALKADIRDLVERSARGEGPEIPWINQEKRVPERLGSLLRPQTIRPAFTHSLVNGPFFPICEQILGAPVRYSLFGMLAGGDGKPYIQAWHRDIAPVEGKHQVTILERGFRTVVQTNAPLFPDRYLTIVPGSHLRPTTEAEREALKSNPVGDIPGQMMVEMEPGDVVFYYPNLLHRGYNPTGAFRWTMHHAFLRASQPVAVHERGQEAWIGQPRYLDSLPPALRVYMQRYLDAIPDGPSPDLSQL